MWWCSPLEEKREQRDDENFGRGYCPSRPYLPRGLTIPSLEKSAFMGRRYEWGCSPLEEKRVMNGEEQRDVIFLQVPPLQGHRCLEGPKVFIHCTDSSVYGSFHHESLGGFKWLKEGLLIELQNYVVTWWELL